MMVFWSSSPRFRQNSARYISNLTKDRRPLQQMMTNLQKVTMILCAAREAMQVIETKKQNLGLVFPEGRDELGEDEGDAGGSLDDLGGSLDPDSAVDNVEDGAKRDEGPKYVLMEIETPGKAGDKGEEETCVITPEMIVEASYRIQTIYAKADENRKIKFSIINQDKLFHKLGGVDSENFIKGLGSKKMTVSNNHHVIPVLKLTTATENPETHRLYQLMYEKIKLEKNVVFDPLGKFA